MSSTTIRRIYAFFPALLIASCVTGGPAHDAGFGNIRTIADLNGTYQNAGDSGKNNGVTYLSDLIWPGDKELKDESIDAIDVRASGPKQITVTALSGGTTVKVQEFVEGKDFTLNSGRIHLKTDVDVENDNFAGVVYMDSYLGLDQSGNGKYRESGATAGIMLLIPVVAGAQIDTRFIRIRQ